MESELIMSDALLVSFEDHITELRERLPKLTGVLRRDALAELKSSIEFLDLIDTLREPGRRDGGAARRPELPVHAPEASASAKP
jgi:hypothetical protein